MPYNKPYSRMCNQTDDSPIESFSLRETEKLYRDLIDNSLGLICAHDAERNSAHGQSGRADALGYEISELVGHNLREFTPQKFHGRVDTYIAHVFEERRRSRISSSQNAHRRTGYLGVSQQSLSGTREARRSCSGMRRM